MPAPKTPANAADNADSASNADIKEYEVAPGRTVTDDEGDHGPGSTVILDVKEGKKLQKLGFLRLDDGSLAGGSAGPATETGVEIIEQK